MNKIISLIIILFLASPVMSGNPGEPSIGNQPSGNSSTKGQPRIIVINRRPAQGGLHLAPSLPLYGTIYVNEGYISMDLPLTAYPLSVEITDNQNYSWSSIFEDEFDNAMSFTGERGEYMLTIIDSNNSTYVSYFTLE